jgi:chromosome segregation protein
VADLRRVEADLETIRQAHYAAGDQVNQAQGLLYEASAEVGRLEAEIRFVVEGRQRVEQRLLQLKEQTAQWATRRDDALAEIRNPGSRPGGRRAGRPAGRPGRRPGSSCPTWKTPCARRRPRQRAARQRGQVQQQIQVLAADQRSIEEQRASSRSAANALG